MGIGAGADNHCEGRDIGIPDEWSTGSKEAGGRTPRRWLHLATEVDLTASTTRRRRFAGLKLVTPLFARAHPPISPPR